MKKLLCTVALVGMLAAPSVVQGQINQAGPFLAYSDDAEAFGIGGYLSIPLPALHPNISLAPNFIWFFPDGDVTFFEINGDLVYNFPVSADSPVLPWVLGGLNIARFSVDTGVGTFSDTNVGINLGGGVDFRVTGSIVPFAGAKIELEGGESFVLFGGIGFAVGG